MRPALAALPLCYLLAGCFPPGEGIEPPSERIYFPVGLALDGDADFLFVANSDFDLQFNAGVLQSYDLERVRAVVPRVCSSDADCASGLRCDDRASDDNGGAASHTCVDADSGQPCGARGESSAADRVLVPDRCRPIDLAHPPDAGNSLISSSVRIGAFATDVIFRAVPPGVSSSADKGRLFLPVRGDTTLHWVDVLDGGAIDCGQGGNDGECDDAHRAGNRAETENTRGLDLPPEPFGVAATADGRAIVVTHQTEGAASLFVNSWATAPRLEFVAGDMPSRPIGVSAVPVPRVVETEALDYQPGFLVGFRNDPSVHLLRFLEDGALDGEGSTPARPYLVDVGKATIRANSVGVDSRGLVVDGSRREAEEERCAAQEAGSECLSQAAAAPVDVFVTNRTPPSLLLGRTRPQTGLVGSDDVPSFYDTLALSAGPSRVVLGRVILADGTRAQRVFVICFDSRLIYVVNPETREVESLIETGRGPYAAVADSEHGLLYVAHFTDSFIGVFSLDQRVPERYGSMLATLGRPSPPRAAK
jgi:hypothetical protein